MSNQNSNRLVFKTDKPDADGTIYRVTKCGDTATIWHCRCNGVWRELKRMPADAWEGWAVAFKLLDPKADQHALLKDLVEGKPIKVYNK